MIPNFRSRRDRATPLTARGIAWLGRSTPSTSSTSGRSDEDAVELERGTTAIRSATLSVLKLSIDTTIAGRFLPGSPGLEAPKDTSHTSPRRGSVDAIFQCRLPETHLFQCRRILSISTSGLSLRLKDRLYLSLPRDLGEQCSQRDSAFMRLVGKLVARRPGHTYGRGFGCHSGLIVAPRQGALKWRHGLQVRNCDPHGNSDPHYCQQTR